jgi:hypothetical protein
MGDARLLNFDCVHELFCFWRESKLFRDGLNLVAMFMENVWMFTSAKVFKIHEKDFLLPNAEFRKLPGFQISNQLAPKFRPIGFEVGDGALVQSFDAMMQIVEIQSRCYRQVGNDCRRIRVRDIHLILGLTLASHEGVRNDEKTDIATVDTILHLPSSIFISEAFRSPAFS